MDEWTPAYPALRDRAKVVASLYKVGFTIEQIASRVNISRASVYRYLKPGLRLLEEEKMKDTDSEWVERRVQELLRRKKRPTASDADTARREAERELRARKGLDNG